MQDDRCDRCGKPPYPHAVALLEDDRGTVWGTDLGCDCPPLCVWCERNLARATDDFCSDDCDAAEDRWRMTVDELDRAVAADADAPYGIPA